MGEPILSPDKKWMWTGSEWIRSPPEKSFLHTTLILITGLLILFNVSMYSVYFVTREIDSFGMLAIASIAGIFLGPLFLMVLGSYFVRSRPSWQRVSFGIFVFLAFYVLDGIYRSLNGMAFLNTWPNAPFFAELVFIPVYAILTVALSTLYLYLLPEKQNFVGRILSSKKYFWNRYIVPSILLVSAFSHIYGLSTLSLNYTIPLMVINSLLSIGALRDLKKKLGEFLGHQGGQIFTVIIMGYSSSLTIITTIQFGGISSSNVDFYSYFVQSNIQMISWPPEARINLLFILKALLELSATATCFYLAYVAFSRKGSVMDSSMKISKYCFSFILPLVLILSIAQYVVVDDSAYIDSSLNYSDNSQNRTGEIRFGIENSNSEFVITVCGEHEHNSTYERGDSTLFVSNTGLYMIDNYSIERSILTKPPSRIYIDSFGVDLECSQLKLTPEKEWTTLNTIISSNASFNIVYIDGDSLSNLHITNQNTAGEATYGAYAILLWMMLIPIYFTLRLLNR